MHYWSGQEDFIEKIMHELEIIGSPSTIVDLKNFHRDVCAQYSINNLVETDGPSHTVETNASCFGKRKSDCEHTIQEQP